MAPFISEELFQRLKRQLEGIKKGPPTDPYTAEAIEALDTNACIIAPYPKVIRESDLNPAIEQTFDLVGKVVYTIRNIRGEVKLTPSQATDIYIVGAENDPNFAIVRDNRTIIAALVKVNKIEMHTKEPEHASAGIGILDTLKIVIPLPTEMLKQEKARLEKERDRLTALLERLKIQLGNEEFVKNAPAQLIEKQNKALLQTENELKETSSKLQKL